MSPLRPKVGTHQKVGERISIVRCNHCGMPVLQEHRAIHAFECRQRRHQLKGEAMNLTKDGRPLYAIAVTRKRHGSWQAPEILYAHGNSPAEAQRVALTAETDPIKVIEIGLAMGWFQSQSGLISG